MNEQPYYHIRLCADDEGYAGFEAFLDSVSAEPLLAADTALKLRLVLEELFTNSMSHARGSAVDISVTAARERVSVLYEDSSPPFNPQEHLPAHHLEDDIAARPVGGLGCLLIVTMTCDLTYQRRDGRNQLSFCIQAIPSA